MNSNPVQLTADTVLGVANRFEEQPADTRRLRTKLRERFDGVTWNEQVRRIVGELPQHARIASYVEHAKPECGILGGLLALAEVTPPLGFNLFVIQGLTKRDFRVDQLVIGRLKPGVTV